MGTRMPASNTLTALVLQGGGALGAYQGGAYESLSAAGREPDWLAGISIGAINSALIAGNAPGRRAARLREFWQRITAQVPSPAWAGADGPLRALANDWAAAWGAVFGLPHFFQPRVGKPWWPGAADAPTNALNPGWLSDVGFGLRIANSRAAFGNVLHIDLAFPLNATPDIKRTQLLVKTKFSF